MVRTIGLARLRELAAATEKEDWEAIGGLIRDRFVAADESQGGTFAIVQKRWDQLEKGSKAERATRKASNTEASSAADRTKVIEAQGR
jgi:hypothetical protein